MIILNIIDWCNNNQGFVGAIVSLLTLIVSVIAIITSVKASKKPYERKLAVSGGVFVGDNRTGLHVTAVNVGNMPVIVKTVGIKVRKNIIINKKTIRDSIVMLKPSETTTQYFYDGDFKAFKDLKSCIRAYAYVEDSEGRKYKKYIGRVKLIQKYFCK